MSKFFPNLILKKSRDLSSTSLKQDLKKKRKHVIIKFLKTKDDTLKRARGKETYCIKVNKNDN